MAAKKIVVLAATSQEQLENDGCDVEQECDTIAEAKKRAKYYLSTDYMNACESSTRLGYAEIRVNGDCYDQLFVSGINPRDLHEDACKDGIDMEVR